MKLVLCLLDSEAARLARLVAAANKWEVAEGRTPVYGAGDIISMCIRDAAPHLEELYGAVPTKEAA